MVVSKYIYYVSSPLRKVEMDVKNGRIVMIGHDACSVISPFPYPSIEAPIMEIVERDVILHDGVYRVFIEKYSESISPIYVREWESQYA